MKLAGTMYQLKNKAPKGDYKDRPVKDRRKTRPKIKKVRTLEQNLKNREINYGWIPKAFLSILIASIQGQLTGITLSLNEELHYKKKTVKEAYFNSLKREATPSSLLGRNCRPLSEKMSNWA